MSQIEHTNSDRFAGAIGDDYHETFKLICPHLDPLEQSVGDAFAPLANRGSIPTVLDLGCGDGLTSVPILKSLSSVHLVAVDSESKMLQGMRNVVSPTAAQVIDYVCADALSFLRGCSDESFDAAGSCFVIHNFTDEYRAQLLPEIYRVLKNGGIFANADKLAEPEPNHSKVFLKQLTLVIDTYQRANRPDLLREWILHYLEDNIPGVIWTEQRCVEQLAELGFRNIQRTFRYDLEATIVCAK